MVLAVWSLQQQLVGRSPSSLMGVYWSNDFHGLWCYFGPVAVPRVLFTEASTLSRGAVSVLYLALCHSAVSHSLWLWVFPGRQGFPISLHLQSAMFTWAGQSVTIILKTSALVSTLPPSAQMTSS